jgi:hypothetical protein
MKNQQLHDVDAIRLNRDALIGNEVPTKSQVETIVDRVASIKSKEMINEALESIIISTEDELSDNTAYSSLYLTKALADKQDKLHIDPSSTWILDITDDSEIKIKHLGPFVHGILPDYKDIGTVLQSIENELALCETNKHRWSKYLEESVERMDNKMNNTIRFVFFVMAWKIASILYFYLTNVPQVSQ